VAEYQTIEQGSLVLVRGQVILLGVEGALVVFDMERGDKRATWVPTNAIVSIDPPADEN
jgi:hypothetical protein